MAFFIHLDVLETNLENCLIDPITYELLEDPVITADGKTYSRSSITKWLQTHNTSPLTNIPLEHRRLTPNDIVRQIIEEYKRRKAAIEFLKSF
jgi:hypothetical protein